MPGVQVVGTICCSHRSPRPETQRTAPDSWINTKETHIFRRPPSLASVRCDLQTL